MVSRTPPPNPRRDLVLALLQEQPGQSVGALSRATGMGHGALRHHTAMLVRMGLIWTTWHGQCLRHFPGRKPSPAEVHELLIEHALDEVDRGIIAWLREVGPQRQVDALNALARTGVPRSSLQLRLNRLVAQGFLVRRKEAHAVTYEAVGSGQQKITLV